MADAGAVFLAGIVTQTLWATTLSVLAQPEGATRQCVATLSSCRGQVAESLLPADRDSGEPLSSLRLCFLARGRGFTNPVLPKSWSPCRVSRKHVENNMALYKDKNCFCNLFVFEREAFRVP